MMINNVRLQGFVKPSMMKPTHDIKWESVFRYKSQDLMLKLSNWDQVSVQWKQIWKKKYKMKKVSCYLPVEALSKMFKVKYKIRNFMKNNWENYDNYLIFKKNKFKNLTNKFKKR